MMTRRHVLQLLGAGPLAAATAPRLLAQDDPDGWREAIAPMKIVGPIHYVGTRGLAVYLVTTPAGHVLIDGGLPVSGPAIVRSIEMLGVKPRDVKVLLITQAHFDHVGTLAHLKTSTGGRVVVMRGDESLIASGGTTDYLFGGSPAYHFPPVAADEVIRDGHEISLGGVTLKAHHTPGHTPGTTTWTTTVEDGGRAYRVVVAGSTSVNPGTRLVRDPSYPRILEDYRTALRVQESLRPDIFLAAHGTQFEFEAKRARAAREGVTAWVDPDGYRKAIAASRDRLEALVAKER
jgi:metallo-beta-lactamase class B